MPKNPNNIETTFIEHNRLRDRYMTDYPNDVDLSPDSPVHKKLLEEILTFVKASDDVLSRRFPTWKELDEKLTVYIDLDAKEQEVQNEDARKPASIVIPVTYATRETLLTYFMAAFWQSPFFRYEASKDPKDIVPTILLESIIANHCTRSKVGLDLYTSWSNGYTYGFGAASPTWETRYRRKTVREKDEFGNETTTKKREIDFDGNALVALDPYNTIIDANVPITNPQLGRGFGWVERGSFYQLMNDEKASDGGIFNVLYVKEMGNKKSSYYNANDSNTGRYSKTGIPFENVQDDKNTVDSIVLYLDIIPKDFALNESDYPETWRFVVTADRVITEAVQVDLDHMMKPVATLSPDSDGQTILPVSVLEREYPLQHAIDWLWQSHITNIRKAVNNMFVVDPSLVNLDDFTDTRYGLVARLRPSAWGRGVREAVEQLQVQDVTRSNIQDIGFMLNIDNMVFTNQQAKGAMERRGDRVSAQEARDTRMSFLSKMEKGAKIGAMQFHYDIAYQMASNTIQFMRDAEYVKLTGDYANVLIDEYGVNTNFVKVEPQALDVGFDVIPQDGTIPGGEYADVWERLLNNAAAHQEVYANVDFTRTWLHIARLLGAKNPQDFLKKPPRTKVEDQRSIERRVQSGQYVQPGEFERATT